MEETNTVVETPEVNEYDLETGQNITTNTHESEENAMPTVTTKSPPKKEGAVEKKGKKSKVEKPSANGKEVKRDSPKASKVVEANGKKPADKAKSPRPTSNRTERARKEGVTEGTPRKKGRPAGSTNNGESKRLRLFKLLDRYPEGLDNVNIRKALKTETIAAVCRDETVYGRLKLVYNPESRGKVFTLSAKGRQALKGGKVDSDKAPVGKWAE